jgi:hypothetical protein
MTTGHANSRSRATDHFGRLGSALNSIAEADDMINVVASQVGKRSVKADAVSVHVGDHGNSSHGFLQITSFQALSGKIV